MSSGFRYKTAPHLTLASIANNEAVIEEPLYDQPVSDSSTVRVTGPFTVEAVPAPTVRSLDELEENAGDGERRRLHCAHWGNTQAG